VLGINLAAGAGRLRTLEGVSPGLIELSIGTAAPCCVMSLAGIQGCTSMEKLSLRQVDPLSCLQLLRGLSSLKQLDVSCCRRLTSLEGLNSLPLLEILRLTYCNSLTHLSGFEHLSALKRLVVEYCGVTSLQPLSQLGEGLQGLIVHGCKSVQEEVLELPHVQPTANVSVRESNVREVLLAGGVRGTWHH
jgi:Leucine-rich repeat (LRR) protein